MSVFVWRQWSARTVGMGVLLLTSLASILWLTETEQRAFAASRATALRAGEAVAFNLRQSLESDMRLVDVMAALVQQGQGRVPDFQRQAAALLRRSPNVVGVGLLPGGVVEQVAPPSVESYVNQLNVLDGIWASPGAIAARDGRRRVVSGPSMLPMRRIGLTVHEAVFLPNAPGASAGADAETFWGLVRVGIDFDALLRSARLDALDAQGLAYQLVSLDRDTSSASDSTSSSTEPPTSALAQVLRTSPNASDAFASGVQPVAVSVMLADLNWRLELLPTSGGWGTGSGLLFRVLWAGFFCIGSAGLAYLLWQRLRFTNSLLESLTEHVPGVLYQYQVAPDGTARFRYLSPGIETLTGLSQVELLQSDQSWRERLPDADRQKLKETLKQAAHTGTAFETEFRLRVANGQERWFWTQAHPQLEPDGGWLWHGYLADWTHEKQTEDALTQTNRLLAEAQEVARVGYFFTDVATGRWTSSPLLDHILGIGPDYDRTAVGWSELVDPAYREGLREAYQNAVVARVGFNVEYPLCRPSDGRLIWVHLMGRLEFAENGQPVRLVGTLQDISTRKKAEADIRNLAFYDPLTGLPNRRLLLDRLSAALLERTNDGRHGALMFIDLDHFKDLNDTMGHDKGDALLRMVALRLLSCVHEHDTVARLGGDEFVLLLSCLEAPEHGKVPHDPAATAEDIGLRVLAALGRPYPLGTAQHTSTPSIGVALFSNDGLSVDDVLKRADVAMYQAKAAGRNTVRFYDPGIQAELTERMLLADDLRKAVLADGQLFLQYQPQHDAAGGLVGAEALLRWKHPSRGMISPAVFIPLAEQVGLMETLGQWVLTTACRQLSDWLVVHRLRERHAQFVLAVNVSAHQFKNAAVATDVQRALVQVHLPAGVLKLELTESLMVHDVEDIIAKMHTIRTFGVQFSLDDFGTGYSSLTYLKRLPLDQLKIDQSFVRDLLTSTNDAAIARTVVALGQTLGLEVIAEGVETPEQREYLLGMGCQFYQGYLFSKPLNAEDFLAYSLKH